MMNQLSFVGYCRPVFPCRQAYFFQKYQDFPKIFLFTSDKYRNIISHGTSMNQLSQDKIQGTGSPGAKVSTRDRLIQSGIQLLSQKWLSEVSVADICRNALLSNGIFYRYFDTKERLFLEILEQYYQVLSTAFSTLAGLTGPEGIEALCKTVFELTDKHRDLTSIFREGQYRYYEFERRINRLYEMTLTGILGRNPSRAQAIYAMAGIRFLAFRRTYHGIQADVPTVARFLTDGIFDGPQPDWAKVFRIEVSPLPMKLEKTTAETLIGAGKELFGRQGFHDVNIHQITQQAKVSVGTFYNYFTGKEEFYEKVISTVSHELRQAISRNLSKDLSRLELELQGMVLFAFYISNIDPSCYNLVREGEFVTPRAVREYYDAFARGYAKHMEGVRSGDSQVAGNFLMGLSHFFGLAILHDPGGYQSLAKNLIQDLGTLLLKGISFQT